MADKIIKHGDVIEDKIFEPTIVQGQLLLDKLNEIIKGFKILASVTGKKVTIADPKTVDEVEKLNKELERLNQIEKGLEDVQKQRYIIQEKLRQAQSKARDEAKASLSAYAKLNLEYKQAAQNAKDLAAAYGIESKAAKAAAQQALALNDKLKAIDASIGNYQRNVGNYHGALTKLTKGFGGLIGITSVVGKALGFNTDALDRMRDTSRELIHIAKDFGNAQKASALATETATAATVVQEATTKKATIAQRIYNTVLGLNPYILLVAAIGLAVAAIYQFVTAENAAEKATRELNEALEFQNNEIQRNVEGYQREYDVLVRKNKNLLTQLEANGATEKELNDQRKKNTREELQLIEKKLIELQRLEKIQVEQRKNAKRGKGATDDEVKKYTELQQAIVNTQDAIQDLEITRDGIIADSQLEDKNFLGKDAKNAETAAGSIAYYNEQLKKANETLDTTVVGTVAYAKALSDVALAQINLDDAIDRAKKQRGDVEIAALPSKNAVLPDVEETKSTANKITGIVLGSAEYIAKELADKEKKRLQEEKERNQERLKLAQQLEDEIFKASEDRINKERELNNQRLSDIDRQIETQTQLAIAGEKNTLGFLQKERAKALEEKAKIEKREAKRKEAQQLAELFLEFYKNFASEKGGSFAAAAKATAATLIAKGIAESFAGAFAEGVENLNGAGTETSDSNIALLSKGESVITARATKETKGLATALNDKGIIGAKEWMLQNISIPQVHPKEAVNNAMMDMVYEQLQSLEKTIKNKKELIVYRNALGDLVREEYESGHRNVIIEKKSFITPKRKLLE